MPFDSTKHHRRSIRLKAYDYSQPGAYFITICTHHRACLFGKVVDGEMRLNDAGRIAEQCWNEIPDHFPHVGLDEFVIMPNHVHGIIWIMEKQIMVGARHAVPLHHAVPQRSLNRIRRYINENPLRWHVNHENPQHTGKDDLWENLFTEAKA